MSEDTFNQIGMWCTSILMIAVVTVVVAAAALGLFALYKILRGEVDV